MKVFVDITIEQVTTVHGFTETEKWELVDKVRQAIYDSDAYRHLESFEFYNPRWIVKLGGFEIGEIVDPQALIAQAKIVEDIIAKTESEFQNGK